MQECIASIINIVDEIIVVDGFSTDRTISICKKYPKIRIFRKFFEGFAKERIFALKQVKGDWVIQIDSDEVLTKKCAFQLKKMIRSDSFDVIRVWNKTFFAGKFLRSNGRIPSTKAFRVGYLYYDKNKLVHETPIIKSQAKIGDSGCMMIHYHDFDLKQIWRKFVRYAKLRIYMEGTSIRKMLSRPLGIFFVRLIKDFRIIDGFHGLFLASIEATAYLFVTLKEIKISNWRLY